MDERGVRREDFPMDATQAGVVGWVFLVAGGVKGVTGMGLPTVAMSLLGLWMPPLQAASLLVVPSLATNAAQCWGPETRPLLARLWPCWTALAVVTVWVPEMEPLSAALPSHHLLVGAATGLLSASTAVFVIPLVPYLQAMRLGKEATVQALGLSFTVATLALAARLQGAGALIVWSAPSFVALGAAFVGLWLGTRIRSRISGPVFQRSLFVAFVGLGVANLSKGS
jgi:uncharacterized protein